MLVAPGKHTARTLAYRTPGATSMWRAVDR